MTEHGNDRAYFAGSRPRAMGLVGNARGATGLVERDDVVRYRALDFGPLRVQVPAEARVRMSNEDGVESDAVFLEFPPGRVRLRVLATPRNGRLWPDLAEEIATSQARAGSRVSSEWGEWGRELQIVCDGEQNRVIGLDGPRWMLFGRATWPMDSAAGLVETMREMMRSSVVRRGDEPMPARTALMLTHPKHREARVEEIHEQPARYLPEARPADDPTPDEAAPPPRLSTIAPRAAGRPAERSRSGQLAGAAALALLGGAALAYFLPDDREPVLSPTELALPVPAAPTPMPAASLPDPSPDPMLAAPLPDPGFAAVIPGSDPVAPAGPGGGSGLRAGAAANAPGRPAVAPGRAQPAPAAANRTSSDDDTRSSGSGRREKSRDTSRSGDGGRDQQQGGPGLVGDLADSVTQVVPSLR